MEQIILGHRGMVGSALHRLVPDALILPRGWDLRVANIDFLLRANEVEVLYLCAARVGGIGRNMAEPGQMLYDNLMIQTKVIEAARLAGVKLIVFLGSSCIYPAHNVSPSWHIAPLREDELLAGPLEPTNEAYAIAKIAGIKLLKAYCDQYGLEYLAVMPCNLYGPGDNFDPETSHFIPGMMRRFHTAKEMGASGVHLWGTGTPRRELMHVDDCARIIVNLVQAGARGLVNIGPGVDYPISRYAELVRSAVGFDGKIVWDHLHPEGVARKLLDVSRMEGFGIGASFVNHEDGISQTYKWFLEHVAHKV